MHRCHRAQLAALPLLVIGSCLFASSAFAGFQWVSPPSENSTLPVAPAPVVIAAPSSPEIISPIIIGGGSISSAPTASPTPAPAPVPAMQAVPTASAPVVLNPAPPPSTDIKVKADAAEIPVYDGPVPPFEPAKPDLTSAAVMPEKPSLATAGTVHGFANAVPVVVALRQILPSGYAFSIDSNVDMGTLVSFKGGHPWRDTLRDALIPVGLEFHEKGQMIDIGYAADAKSTVNSASLYQPGTEPHPFQIPEQGIIASPEKQTAKIEMANSPVTSSVNIGPADGFADVGGQIWSGERGSSLHKILSEWCQRAHVELNWVAEYDYPLDATVSFTGNFQDAVRNILTGFEAAHPQPVAELHSNPGLGQMVLVVQSRGNTNTD